jgi:hypothetical protein
MNNVFKTASLFVLSAFFMVSCDQKPAENIKVTTDLINIPATATGDADAEKAPKIEFESDTFDFGVISQGEKVSHTFKFKNSGKSNLIISSAKGSCGCTVPEYPKKPIAPGESGEISVVFDSEGKSGKQNKSVTVLANTFPSTTVISITGEIIAPTVNK